MTTYAFDPDLFADALDVEEEDTKIRATTTVPVVRPAARVTSRTRETHRGYLTRPPQSWTWEDLRSYVVSKIQELHGEFPRNEAKEFGIFSSFAGRHDELSGPIAVFAFETQPTPGYWKGAPISITRFCKGSDPYFAEQIKQRISQA